MSRFSCSVFALVLVCFVSLVSVNAMYVIGTEFSLQACRNVLIELESERLKMFVNGTRMTFYPKRDDGTTYDTGAALTFQWIEVGEYSVRYPTIYDPTPGCSPAYESTDLKNDQPTQLIHIKDCDCIISDYEQLQPGFHAVGFMANITNCPAPQQHFHATAYVSISNETRQELWSNTLPGSSFDHFYYTQIADGVKFGFALSNWTWSSDAGIPVPNADQAYLAPGFEFGFYSEMPMVMNQTMMDTSMLMNSTMGGYTFNFWVDLGYVLDGRPAVVADSLSGPLFYFDLAGGTNSDTYVVPMRLAFCPPRDPFSVSQTQVFPHYKDIWYDPSLEVFFTPPSGSPGASGPQAAKQKAQQKQWVVAVAVTIPLVALLLLALILLAIFVPAVRLFFRPFANKNGTTRIQQTHITNAQEDEDHLQNSSKSHSSLEMAPLQSQTWAKPTLPTH